MARGSLSGDSIEQNLPRRAPAPIAPRVTCPFQALCRLGPVPLAARAKKWPSRDRTGDGLGVRAPYTGNMAATAAAKIALRLFHHPGGLAAVAWSPASSFSLGRVSSSSCCGLTAAVRKYSSEAKGLEEELRVRYLDDEHKGNGCSRRGWSGVFFFFLTCHSALNQHFPRKPFVSPLSLPPSSALRVRLFACQVRRLVDGTPPHPISVRNDEAA